MKITQADAGIGRGPEAGGAVHSALLRACLPESDRDQGRRLAWVGAMAAMVLMTGVLGRREPREFIMPSLEFELPMVFPAEPFTPPPDPSPAHRHESERPESGASLLSMAPPLDRPEMPRLEDMALGWPEVLPLPGGPSRGGSAGRALPLPLGGGEAANRQSGDGNIELFRVDGSDRAEGGYFPKPEYPREARLRREQGEVQLLVEVDEAGRPVRVDIRVPSGSPTLDRETVNHVRRHWRWPVGAKRRYLVPWAWTLR